MPRGKSRKKALRKKPARSKKVAKKKSKKEPEKKNPVGRPSEYEPEYCQMLIDHMATGLSFESFAGKVGHFKDALYRWVEKYPEFSNAYKRGRDLCLLWWERLGQAGATGNVTRVKRQVKDDKGKVVEEVREAAMFNAATWIFNMKNRFKKDWKDRHEVDLGEETKKSLAGVIKSLTE